MNAWLERHRTLVLVIVGLAVAGSAGAVAIRWQRPAVIEIEPPPPTRTPGPVTVYVSGAVAAPDVYQLPPGSIVRDAVDAAGGPTDQADLNVINLAASLGEGQQVRVPAVGEVLLTDEGTDEAVVIGPLNLNTASAAELEILPGIGPALAQAIVDYREAYGPFTDITQIQNVSGIGPAKFESLQGLITVE